MGVSGVKGHIKSQAYKDQIPGSLEIGIVVRTYLFTMVNQSNSNCFLATFPYRLLFFPQWTAVRTRGFELIKQVLYCFNHTSSSFCLVILEMGSHKVICLDRT
jgi:1-acyl-sn-glycerol-3-phosphate acyltransferase